MAETVTEERAEILQIQGIKTHSTRNQRKNIRKMKQGMRTQQPPGNVLTRPGQHITQPLKNGLDWGMEDEVMVECPKLKQYFGVDTFLIQRISGQVCLHTKDEDKTFPISCSKTKFPIPLLKKALEGAEQQRATPKDLPGED